MKTERDPACVFLQPDKFTNSPQWLIQAFPHPHLSFITLGHVRAAEMFSASNRFLTTRWKQPPIQLMNFLKLASIERETFSCQDAFWKHTVCVCWDSLHSWCESRGDWLKLIMQRSRNVSNISWGLTQSNRKITAAIYPLVALNYW